MSLLNRVLNAVTMPTPHPHPISPPPEFAGAQIAYQSEGRSGSVIFAHAGTRFSMYYEFAGGNALAIIDIPTVKNWTARTGLPLHTRDPLLRFIAATVAHDQTTNHTGTYTISANAITIYP